MIFRTVWHPIGLQRSRVDSCQSGERIPFNTKGRLGCFQIFLLRLFCHGNYRYSMRTMITLFARRKLSLDSMCFSLE